MDRVTTKGFTLLAPEVNPRGWTGWPQMALTTGLTLLAPGVRTAESHVGVASRSVVSSGWLVLF